MTSHDSLTWTWTAPSGERFGGTPDFIAGVKRGWEARAWAPPMPRCKFAATCEHANSQRERQPNGGTW